MVVVGMGTTWGAPGGGGSIAGLPWSLVGPPLSLSMSAGAIFNPKNLHFPLRGFWPALGASVHSAISLSNLPNRLSPLTLTV